MSIFSETRMWTGLTVWTQQPVMYFFHLRPFGLKLKKQGMTFPSPWKCIAHAVSWWGFTFTISDRVTVSMRPLSGTLTISLSHDACDAMASALTVTFTTPVKVTKHNSFIRNSTVWEPLMWIFLTLSYTVDQSNVFRWPYPTLRATWSSSGFCVRCHTDRKCTRFQTEVWGYIHPMGLLSRWPVEDTAQNIYEKYIKTQLQSREDERGITHHHASGLVVEDGCLQFKLLAADDGVRQAELQEEGLEHGDLVLGS